MPEDNNVYRDTFNGSYNPRSDGPTYARAFYVYFSEFPGIIDEIAEACMYPVDGKIIYKFDHDNLSRFSIVIADDLLTYPTQLFEYAASAMIQLCNDFGFSTEPINDVIFRIYNIDVHRKKMLKTLDKDQSNQIVSVDGIVTRLGEILTGYSVGAFRCMRCQEITTVPQKDIRWMLQEPFECVDEQCGRSGPFEFLVDESTSTKMQLIQISELTTNIRGGETPRSMPVLLTDDLTGKANAGGIVHLNAKVVLRPQYKGKSMLNARTTELDGNYIEMAGTEIDEIEVSPEDRERLFEISENEKLFEILINSFAPNIVLLDPIKLGILCSIVSGPNSMDGEGLKHRNYLHVLMCGDPATGKSELLLAVVRLIPRAQFATGDAATVIGLTAAVTKDETFSKGWVVDPGVLPLADQSVACVDEGDKLKHDDVNHINSILTLQEMVVNKAGLNVKIPCRCPVLWAANPKHGRFDRYGDFTKQINMPSDTMSRFDLIYVLVDTIDPIRDEKISNAMDGGWKNDELERMTQDDLKKYIFLARSIHEVTIPDDVKKILKGHYQQLRALGGIQDTIAVTPRHEEALSRIARSVAKLHLKDVVSQDHARAAINIMNESLRQSGTDMVTGKIDSDIVALGRSVSQKERNTIVRDIIHGLQTTEQGALTPLIIATCEGRGLTKRHVELSIDDLLRSFHIIKLDDNKYRVV